MDRMTNLLISSNVYFVHLGGDKNSQVVTGIKLPTKCIFWIFFIFVKLTECRCFVTYGTTLILTSCLLTCLILTYISPTSQRSTCGMWCKNLVSRKICQPKAEILCNHWTGPTLYSMSGRTDRRTKSIFWLIRMPENEQCTVLWKMFMTLNKDCVVTEHQTCQACHEKIIQRSMYTNAITNATGWFFRSYSRSGRFGKK